MERFTNPLYIYVRHLLLGQCALGCDLSPMMDDVGSWRTRSKRLARASNTIGDTVYVFIIL